MSVVRWETQSIWSKILVRTYHIFLPTKPNHLWKRLILKPKSANISKSRFNHLHKGKKLIIVQLYSPSSTTFTEKLITPTKIDTWKSKFKQILQTLGLIWFWRKRRKEGLILQTLVARASRLLYTSSSTTLVMSNMIIPERMEWRTPSGKDLIVFISEFSD